MIENAVDLFFHWWLPRAGLENYELVNRYKILRDYPGAYEGPSNNFHVQVKGS